MTPSPPPSKSGFLTWGHLRDILLVALIGVVTWKLVSAELKLDLSAFSFTDLLALLLSLFSVWLSVAFYFKASEASNQFYDNTYRFTKDMSEILGRIEAGFGERLRHLDEGYSGLRERFDRIPLYDKENAADDAVKQEEAEIRKKEEEQKKVLEDLAAKAKLAVSEKEALFAHLARTNHELESARDELKHLKRVATETETGSGASRAAVVRWFARKLDEAIPPGVDLSSRAALQRVLQSIKTELPRAAIRDMQQFSLLDEDGNLTREGFMRIRVEQKRMRSESGNLEKS